MIIARVNAELEISDESEISVHYGNESDQRKAEKRKEKKKMNALKAIEEHEAYLKKIQLEKIGN